MSRPDEGLLHEWLDGELSPEESARVEALVASDPAWAEAAAEARGLRAASSRILQQLDQVPGDVIPIAGGAKGVGGAAMRRSVVRPWMRVAAGLVLVVGTALLVRPKETLTSPETVASQEAITSTAAAPSGATQNAASSAVAESPVSAPRASAPPAADAPAASRSVTPRSREAAPAEVARAELAPRQDSAAVALEKESRVADVAARTRVAAPQMAAEQVAAAAPAPMTAPPARAEAMRVGVAAKGVAGGTARSFSALSVAPDSVSCWQLNEASRAVIQLGGAKRAFGAAPVIETEVLSRDGSEIEFTWRWADTLRTTKARQIGAFLRGETRNGEGTSGVSVPFVARRVGCGG